MTSLSEPAKAFQPIDTEAARGLEETNRSHQTGKLTPEASVGQGSAPYKWMWCDESGGRVQGPSRYVIMVPAWHNADSVGYNLKATGRPIESWANCSTRNGGAR